MTDVVTGAFSYTGRFIAARLLAIGTPLLNGFPTMAVTTPSTTPSRRIPPPIGAKQRHVRQSLRWNKPATVAVCERVEHFQRHEMRVR